MFANVFDSSATFTCSFASIAWCRPLLYLRPYMIRPVNSSTINTSPDFTM